MKDIRGLVVCSENSKSHRVFFGRQRVSESAEGKTGRDAVICYIIHLQCTYSSSASAQRTLGGGVDLLPRARRGLSERMLQTEELSIKGPGGQGGVGAVETVTELEDRSVRPALEACV